MSIDSIDILLTKKLYHEVPEWSPAGVPFLIAKTNSGTIKGEMYDPREGERYRLYGEWKTDKQRGTDFYSFYSFEILINRSKSGIIDYLERYIPGFGPVRAGQLYEKYGDETLDILTKEPARATEISGITERLVEEIREHFESSRGFDPHDYAAIYGMLSEFQPPQRVIREILTDFKSSAIQVIKENPYILLSYQGMGWKTVDSIALAKIKYERSGVHRFKAAILEVLKQAASDGDTYLNRLQLKAGVQTLCGFGGPFDEAIISLTEEEMIEVEIYQGKEYIADIEIASHEKEIATRIHSLIKSYNPNSSSFATEGLEGEQVDATKLFETSPFAILTGGAGVGKTFTITNMVRSLHRGGHAIQIHAPTGKAAKRAGEVLEQWIPGSLIPCSTIHKALGSVSSHAPAGANDKHAKFGRGRKALDFIHGETSYLDLDVAIADESSMIDVSLFAAWLRAIAPGSRVVMVGDENQLPSVGPGAILRDMIEAGVPTARLTQPRRNSGRIVKACHAIKDGITPSLPETFDPSIGENWMHIESEHPDTIAEIIVDLHRNPDRDMMNECQVISPENAKKPIACANLNRLLSAYFNPQHHTISDKTPEDSSKYAINDKVVRLKNGIVPLMVPLPDDLDMGAMTWQDTEYHLEKTYVVNGDIGQVLDFVKCGAHKYVVVRFKNPDRLCRLPLGDAQIALAYAVTCHKFQGCGVPVCILPVHNSFYWDNRTNNGLWCREWLYTAFSRAEEVLITVGPFDSIAKAVSRKTSTKRKTRLARFIREELAK